MVFALIGIQTVCLLICLLSSAMEPVESINVGLLSLMKLPRYRKPLKKVSSISFDELGELPQIKSACEAIERHASTVAVLQTENSTVISYSPASGPLNNPMVSLEQPIGAAVYHKLFHPKLVLLITGIAGDCRMVVHHARFYILDFQEKFGTTPTGELIADSIGAFLLKKSYESIRPLACHAFVIDARIKAQRSIHEIETTGLVQLVRGGIAGRGSRRGGKQLLEEKFSEKLSAEEARELLQDAIRVFSESQQADQSVPPQAETSPPNEIYFNFL